MGDTALRHRLVAILSADAVGYSRLMGIDERAALAALDAARQVFRQCVDQHLGRVVDTAGDSVLAVFDTAAGAVQAALGIQQQLTRSDGERPEDSRLRFRIGVHLGDVIEKPDGSIYGNGVNVAARLQALAAPGNTLVSEAVRSTVGERTGCTFESQGKYVVKNIAEPVHTYCLSYGGNASQAERSSRQPLGLGIASDRSSSNLPEELHAFFGRERELTEIRDLLRSARLLTVTGVGGIGKTRLALRAAAEARDAYRDGVWFVDLAPLIDSASVPSAVAQALGIKESGGQPLTESLCGHLRARELLLILDNCEHVLTACAQLTETLLRRVSGLTLLATSREPLRIDAERTYPLNGLPLPDPAADAQSIACSDAVQLFVERASRHRPRFLLNGSRAAAVAEICVRLDGIPLALELAAARTMALPVEEIVRLLDQRFRLLTSGSRSKLPRHQTLRAMLDWSYALLNDAEKELFVRLSVFAGGWTLDAALIVCAGEPIEKDEVVYLLIALVEKSLVVPEEQGDRYRMLETVREYARELLGTCETGDSVRERHRNYFLAMAQTASPALSSCGRDESIWLEKLESEQENLRTAIAWSLEHSDESALQFCGLLQEFWLRQSRSREGRRWCDAAVARAGAADSTARFGNAVLAAGIFAFRLGDYRAARSSLSRALEIAKIANDRQLQIEAVTHLGSAEFMQQNFAQAQERYQQALAIARETGDRRRECEIFINMTNLSQNQGDMVAAAESLRSALTLSRDLNDPALHAQAILYEGVQAWFCGDLATAKRSYELSLSMIRATGSRVTEASPLRGLARVAVARGEFDAARALYLDSYAASKEHGDPGHVDEIARMAMALSSPEDAARIAGGADALRHAFGLKVWPIHRERIQDYRQRCRDALGDARYATFYETGRALDPDGVVSMTRAWLSSGTSSTPSARSQ